MIKNKLIANNIEFQNLQIEVNSKINLYDLIKKEPKIKIITNNYKIDTSKLGKQVLKIHFTKNKKEYDIPFEITIVDTTAPKIDGKDLITTNKGSKINLLEEVNSIDNSNEKLEISIKGKYDLTKEGEYNLKYYTKDSSGNIAEKDFVLKVISLPQAPNNYQEYQNLKDGDYITNTGHTLTIKNGIAYIDNHIIVNKTYSLTNNYKPINPYTNTITTDSCTLCIDKETMKTYKQMEADAKSIGLNIYISSGYRSYNRQQTLYQNYCNRDGITAADKYSARAGHSEHQTGYCFDLNTIDDSFAYTDEGKWINNNAHLYGFIIRYPKGKENITGYQYESWHLRYVGIDLAKKLYNNGNWITIEEYYGLTSNYN